MRTIYLFILLLIALTSTKRVVASVSDTLPQSDTSILFTPQNIPPPPDGGWVISGPGLVYSGVSYLYVYATSQSGQVTPRFTLKHGRIVSQNTVGGSVTVQWDSSYNNGGDTVVATIISPGTDSPNSLMQPSVVIPPPPGGGLPSNKGSIMVYGGDPESTSATANVTIYPYLNAADLLNNDTTIAYNSSPGIITCSPATGSDGSYSYQWMTIFKGVWTNISGATGLSYNPGPLVNSSQYQLKVTSGPYTLYTDVLTITVVPPFTPGHIAPENKDIVYNTSPGTLICSAALGTGSFTYQWEVSIDQSTWQPVSGATALSYTPGNLVKRTFYRVKVTNASIVQYTPTAFINVGPVSGTLITQDQNYVYTQNLLHGSVISDAAIDALPPEASQQQITYFDGIGRPLQNIAIQANPTGKDLVTPIDYDAMGRQTKSFLPYPGSGAPASYRSNALNTNNYVGSEQYLFYQQHADSSIPLIPGNPYSLSSLETAPLNRVIEQGFPGQTWAVGSGHTVKTVYTANTLLDSVRIWAVNSSTAAGVFSSYSVVGIYNAGQLFKTIKINENGKQTIEFKDKTGNLILKKVQLTATDGGAGSGYTGWLSTYYLYDDIGNLRAVIQPEGVARLASSSWALTPSLLSEQCFRYEYDGHNRINMKKVPGAAEVYIVYNKEDLPVMTQDGNGRSRHEWLVTVYDNINRPTQTRIFTTTATFVALIANAAANTVYPGSVGTLLTQTHYDDYSGLPSGLSATLSTTGGWSSQFAATSNTTFPYPQLPVKSTATKGLVTWTQTAILDSTPAAYLSAVNIYDDKNRVIQTQQKNITGGIDVFTTEYSWSGQPIMIMQSQQKSGTNAKTTTLLSKNNFDHQGRVINTVLKINTGTLDTTSVLLYDAIGQLQQKQLGKRRSSQAVHTAISLELQDFQYNSRGWLLGVNRAFTRDPNSTSMTASSTTQTISGEMFTESSMDIQSVIYPSTRFFGFDLGYDVVNNVLIGNQSYAASQYNGNISGMAWKSAHDNKVRKYDFVYDAADRLNTANFNQYVSQVFTSSPVNYTVSGLSYDANGNILKMNQYGLKGGGTSAIIDQLTYNYQPGSNKLSRVSDAAPVDSAEHLGDFQNGVNTGDDYTYDASGNMASDANKKITAIIYNSLNLPEVIRVGGKGSIYYSYDATGNKLRKRTVDSTSLPAKTVVTTYINSGVYLNDTLQFFGTTEGRVRPVGTIFVNDYFLKDHLGNTRMVITDDYNVASPILEASSYYPFGLQQKGIGLIASSPIHNFKITFQKQEINEDLGVDIYEFKYRMDDPQIGRFWQIDPLADKYVYNSTYAFSENKVTSHVELEGLESVLFRYALFPTIFSPPTKQEAKANGRAIHGLVKDLKKASIESILALSAATLKGYYKVKSLFDSPQPASTAPNATVGEAPSKGQLLSSEGQTGSYTNTHQSGKKYHGKGTKERAAGSGKEKAEKYDDPLVHTDHTEAGDDREAFKQESRRLENDVDSKGNRGHKSENNYNKRDSPGTKYRKQDED